jgi:N-acyl homoserine lactone hydrolase
VTQHSPALTEYKAHRLVTGVPGRSTTHVGMGWSSVYLLQAPGVTVLVDTGPPVYVDLLKAGLAELGLRPGDVTHLLVTHLHWDHVCNFTMFDSARVVVSEAELDWAYRQPVGTLFVPDVHVEKLHRMRDQLLLVRDGQQPVPGITTIATPGHTPGHVAYQAPTPSGDLVFAGDAVKNRRELATGEAESTLDPVASRESIARLRDRLAGDARCGLVPGHDVRLSWRDGDVVTLDQLDCDVVSYVGDHGAPVRRSLA